MTPDPQVAYKQALEKLSDARYAQRILTLVFRAAIVLTAAPPLLLAVAQATVDWWSPLQVACIVAAIICPFVAGFAWYYVMRDVGPTGQVLHRFAFVRQNLRAAERAADDAAEKVADL